MKQPRRSTTNHCRTVFQNLNKEADMSKIKVGAFSVSLDGLGAGPNQDRKNGLGTVTQKIRGENATHVILKKNK
jgi:hypothetical protein